MKKILIFFSLILFAYISFSQANTGFTIGSNFSTYTGDSTTLPFNNIKPGLNTGIFWDINSGYKTYIQIGGFYSQQGARYKQEYFTFGNKVTYLIRHNVDYINIPISWKQIWGDWFTILGLYGEFAIVSKSKWTETDEYADTIIYKVGDYQSFTNELRTFDAGIKLAMGIQVPISSQNDFTLSVAYNHGFLCVNPNTNRVENKMFNRFFTVNLGIIISRNNYKYKSRR